MLTEVKTGQVIGLPVYNPNDWRTIPLVNRGAEVNAAILARLEELGVEAVWIQDINTESIDRRIRPETQQALRDFVAAAGQFWEGVRKSLLWISPNKNRAQALDAAKVTALIRPVIEAFRSDRHRIDSVQALPRLQDTSVDRLTMRVLLCLCLAIEMETEIFQEKLEKIRKYRRSLSLKDYQSAKDMTAMAIGTLLLDYPDLLNLETEDGQSPDAQMRKDRQAIMLREVEQFSVGTARMMIRIRHQNFDGSGSPQTEHEDENGRKEVRGMIGPEIHLLGRVSRVVDLFTGHLVENHSWIASLGRMQEEEAAKVDPIILDSFLRMLPPFPVGSLVMLNDGRQAVVLRENSELPCRPVLIHLDPGTGQPVEIDLASEPVTTLYVDHTIDAPEVPCMDHYFSNVNISLY